MDSPSIVAYIALIAIVPLSALLFASFGPARATVLVLLGAPLLLPARLAFDFPLVPPLNRETLAAICATVGCLLMARRRVLAHPPGTGVDSFALVLLVGAWFTVFTNRDPVIWGSRVIQGLAPYDAVSMGVAHVLTLWMPFYLGRILFRQPRDLAMLLGMVAVAALLYTPPILFELRMSPELHRLVYGYDAMHYAGAHRWGGFRPTVFMTHGLSLALFMLSGVLACVGLHRARYRPAGISAGIAAWYLSVIFVFCKGLAAIAYALLVVPLALWWPPRRQLLAASLLVVLVFAYPILRAGDLFPTERLTAIAARVSESRAQSLAFRFANEDRLLNRARNRIWFGWGGYNRNRVFDPRSGEDRTITDGYWIISMGIRGIVGFVGAIGLLLVPVFLAAASIRRIESRRDRLLVATTAWIVTVNGVDLLPNAMLTPFAIFTSGALSGVFESVRAHRTARRRGAIARRGRGLDALQRPLSNRNAPATDRGECSGGSVATGLSDTHRRRGR